MFLSINWLRDYLAKPDVKIDPKDLADKLTMRGIQVAAIRRSSLGLQDVVVGRIEHIEKHPNADRLQVTRVVVSSEADSKQHQVVCGAKNIAVGDIVPVALPGAVLPGDFRIKVSQIRGVESSGMICSAKELGIEDESQGEGILQLPKHSVLGQLVSELMGGHQDDVILELELTANRPDCLSMMGLAREIAPLYKTKVREPKPARFRTTTHRTSSIIKVEADEPLACPRYVARVIDGLKVTESPDWIKQRLQAVGIRPINNIVDITNFVMIEYGQPMHAFDLRKIETGTLRIATCKAPSQMTLLNEQNVTLQEGDILILDGDRPIALAGIMGAANSQVEPDTTSIVLESAAFDAKQIRRTAKRLGIVSEAAKRFEKGSDLAAVAAASERAAALLRDSFSANVYHPAIDTNEYGVKETVLSVDMREVRRVTGLKQISAETVADLLESVGISSHKKSVNVLSVRLPTFRQDLKDTIDIVEEVARLNGYDAIPQHLPVSLAIYDRTDETLYDFEMRAKHTLCSLGLRETIHYSFTSEQNLAQYGLLHENRLVIRNPISEDMKVMRTSLLPSLLQTYAYNKNRKISDQKLFEVGRTYVLDDGEETKAKETTHAAGLLSGKLLPQGWKEASASVDFYHAKGIVEALTRQLTTVFLNYEPLTDSKLFHPNRSAVLKLGLKEVGWVGEVHPNVRKKILDTQEAVVLFELNLEALRRFERTNTRYKIPSKFPSVEFDLAFVVERSIASNLLSDTIRTSGGKLLSEVGVFDVYEGEHIGAGKKSLGFRLTFKSPDRTLLEQEISELREKIVQSVSEKFSAQLRA